MTKILVTGGAGYIGSHTVVELVTAGFTPITVCTHQIPRLAILYKYKLE